MKIRLSAFAPALCFLVLFGVGTWISGMGCTPQEAKNATKDALSIAQIACIMASTFTDSEHVMQACGIVRDVKPAVDALLSQKAAAQRARACMSSDAGAKDAGRD